MEGIHNRVGLAVVLLAAASPPGLAPGVLAIPLQPACPFCSCSARAGSSPTTATTSGLTSHTLRWNATSASAAQTALENIESIAVNGEEERGVPVVKRLLASGGGPRVPTSEKMASMAYQLFEKRRRDKESAADRELISQGYPLSDSSPGAQDQDATTNMNATRLMGSPRTDRQPHSGPVLPRLLRGSVGSHCLTACLHLGPRPLQIVGFA